MREKETRLPVLDHEAHESYIFQWICFITNVQRLFQLTFEIYNVNKQTKRPVVWEEMVHSVISLTKSGQIFVIQPQRSVRDYSNVNPQKIVKNLETSGYNCLYIEMGQILLILEDYFLKEDLILLYLFFVFVFVIFLLIFIEIA